MFSPKRAIGSPKNRILALACSLIFGSAISSAQDAVLSDFVSKVFTSCHEEGVYYFGPVAQPVALCDLNKWQGPPARDCQAVYEFKDIHFFLEGSTLVMAQYPMARQHLISDGVWLKVLPYLDKPDSRPYIFGELSKNSGSSSWHIGRDLQPFGLLIGIIPGAELTVERIEANKVVCDANRNLILPSDIPLTPETAKEAYDKALRLYHTRGFTDAGPQLAKLCLYGIAASCEVLGSVYYMGVWVHKDYAEALRDYEMACKGGNADGCAGLGWLYANGHGPIFKDEFGYGPPAQDYPRARALFKSSCDAGSMRGCYGLGALYAHGTPGKGGKKDKDMARLYLKKACDGGDRQGCEDLKAMP